eukprot:14387088-Ditylum_brightwellii.AAC.1
MVITNNNLICIKQQHTEVRWRDCDKVISSQSAIGWLQLLYGRFASTQIKQQHQYEYKTKAPYDADPKWLRKLIKKIWLLVSKQWEYCNKLFVSETEEETRSYRIQKEVLLHRMKGLYAKQQTMLNIDCLLFQRTLEEWEECSQSQMMQWLTSFQPHIHYCTSLAKKQQRKKLQDIRHFSRQHVPHKCHNKCKKIGEDKRGVEDNITMTQLKTSKKFTAHNQQEM